VKESILKTVNLKRSFGKGISAVHAINGMNLEIEKGKLVALKGRSGSGKTTLINILGTLDSPTEGEVYFLGKEITKMNDKQQNEIRRSQIGFVFQSFGLVTLMTAYENVEFGLRIARVPSSERKVRAEQALELVGLTKRMNHRPFELSGGEQQRVAIARAFAHSPQLILADEPTAELDSKMTFQVMNVFRDMISKGITIVMTTHDQAIMEIVDQVYELEDGKLVR
jgi:putative ABC transport system ATP-binding protein